MNACSHPDCFFMFSTSVFQSSFSCIRNSVRTAARSSVRAVCAMSCRYLPPFSRRSCAPPATLCYSNNTLQRQHEAPQHFTTTRHVDNQRLWFVKLALQQRTFWFNDSRMVKDLMKSCEFWTWNIYLSYFPVVSPSIFQQELRMQVFHISNAGLAEISFFFCLVWVELLWVGFFFSGGIEETCVQSLLITKGYLQSSHASKGQLTIFVTSFLKDEKGKTGL